MRKSLKIIFGFFLLIMAGGVYVPKTTFAAYLIDGSYPGCPTTCTTANPGTCAKSEPGNCPSCGTTSGDCCSSIGAWQKYRASCKLIKPGTCNWVWVFDTQICSTADKCISGETGLRAGSCDCGYGGIYKTCCLGSTPVACQAYGIQDGTYPDEGVCPSGADTVFCGFGDHPACGADACQSPSVSPPDPEPLPTSPPPATGNCDGCPWWQNEWNDCLWCTTEDQCRNSGLCNIKITPGAGYCSSPGDVRCCGCYGNPPPPPPCTPNCSCAADTCVGQTCPDGCGGSCPGTKTSPAAPSGLTCFVNFFSCVSGGSVTVSLGWMDNSTNETGFKVYHNSSFLYTTLANTTTYSHQVNCDRSLHSYQVRSTNSCGDSTFSNPCSVQCVDIAPDQATSLSDGTFQDNRDIPLYWNDISNWGLNCTGNTNEYRVYYCKAGPGCTSTSVPETNRCLPVVNNSPTTGYSSCTIPGPLSWESTYYWKVVTSNGALTSEAFGSFEITYPSAWWQTKTGDVYGNNIFSPIWRDATSPYFSLISPFGSQSGLVASLNTANNDFSGDITGPNAKGENQATQTEFSSIGHQALAANLTPLLNDYSYDQLAHLVDLAIKDNKQESYNSEVKVISGVSAEGIEKSELTDPDDANKIIYYYSSDSGSVSVNNPLTIESGDKKFIIFIDGDLHINQNITVTPGGFLAFIVSGDIEIAADVTQVQGVYFADGSLTVESKGDTSEQQFNGQGIFVGKNGVFLERNFRSAANTTTPTEIFTFDPAYLFIAPKVFREKPYLWQEVIP